jgi:predicted dehydrogenase
MGDTVKKVLVVGLGSIGKRHVQVIRELYPNIIISALKNSPWNGSEMGVDKCLSSIDDALAFKPNAAIVANPATKHLDTARILAENGIHLLIEKPISASSAGVQDLIGLCESKKIVLMTGYNLRFLPSLIEFRNLIQTRRVGKIYSVQAEIGQYLPDWRPEKDYKKTVSAQKKLGGGVLLELSHDLNYLTWIFGPIGWVKSHISKQSNLEIDVEDTAHIILGFKDIEDDLITATLNMDCLRRDTSRQCKVVGAKGSLLWDGIKGEVKGFFDDGKGWQLLSTSKPEKNHTYAEEIKHFFSLIMSGKPSLISGRDGLETVYSIEAIRKANDTGSIVYL